MLTDPLKINLSYSLKLSSRISTTRSSCKRLPPDERRRGLVRHPTQCTRWWGCSDNWETYTSGQPWIVKRCNLGQFVKRTCKAYVVNFVQFLADKDKRFEDAITGFSNVVQWSIVRCWRAGQRDDMTVTSSSTRLVQSSRCKVRKLILEMVKCLACDVVFFLERRWNNSFE